MTMIRLFFVVLPPGRVPKTQTQMNIASGPHPYILQQTASSDEFLRFGTRFCRAAEVDMGVERC